MLISRDSRFKRNLRSKERKSYNYSDLRFKSRYSKKRLMIIWNVRARWRQRTRLSKKRRTI